MPSNEQNWIDGVPSPGVDGNNDQTWIDGHPMKPVDDSAATRTRETTDVFAALYLMPLVPTVRGDI